MVASVMACRLFRELKLGIFRDPMTEQAVSKVVFRDIGLMSHEHSECTFEPGTAGIDIGGADKPDAWDIENHPGIDALVDRG